MSGLVIERRGRCADNRPIMQIVNSSLRYEDDLNGMDALAQTFFPQELGSDDEPEELNFG